jgi:SAM-dependent methyltransferase
MDFNQVHLYRAEELNKVRIFFPTGAHILEIGAGAGWQARTLSEWGYKVTAIDIAGGRYEQVRVYPVENYDGVHLPFPDKSFDVIFSSNTLEHVKKLSELSDEMKRALKDNGICVHLVPSASWSIWTSITHYINSIKEVYRKISGKRREVSSLPDSSVQQAEPAPASHPGKINKLFRYLWSLSFPRRHGERGTVWLEPILFSGWYWSLVFKRQGWIISQRTTNGFFYTGYSVCGPRLSLQRRKPLANCLGSSCNIFVLKKG